MSGSTIPDTLDALVAMFTAANVDGLQVVYGPAWDNGNDVVVVGWDRSDAPAVAAINVRDDAAGARGHESYDVSCLLSLGIGNRTLPEVCRAAFASFDLLAAALKADLTLGRTVQKTWISTYEMTPLVVEETDLVEIRFTVSVDAIK